MFLGNGEKAGSGADIIKKGWSDNNWPEPTLLENTKPNEIQVTLLVEDTQESNQKNNQKSNQKSINPTQSEQRILKAIAGSVEITIKELQELTGLSESRVKKVIRNLRTNNLIKRVGPDNGGHWEIVSNDR